MGEGTILVDGRNLCFGSVREWRSFVGRHRPFMDNLENLLRVIEALMNRAVKDPGPTGSLVFLMGRIVVEEFHETLLLAANGHGLGALRITRGMFERVVTAKYLQRNPFETARFMDFHHVSLRKLALASRREFPDRPWLSADRMAEIESQYQRVKEQFTVTDCKKCGTTKIDYRWHKLDLVSMARAVDLGDVSLMGYSIPMQETHATVASLLARIQEGPDGTLSLRSTTPDAADKALCGAHANLLYMMDIQLDQFSPEFESYREPLSQQFEAFTSIWRRPAKGGAS